MAGAPGLLVAVVGVRALGRDEHLVAGQTASADGLADPGLVAIGRRRVDMPVALGECTRARLRRLLRRDQEDTEPQARNRSLAVAEREVRGRRHLRHLRRSGRRAFAPRSAAPPPIAESSGGEWVQSLSAAKPCESRSYLRLGRCAWLIPAAAVRDTAADAAAH